MIHKFENGSMWEGGGFSIHTDYECSELGGGEMCPHCHSKTTKTNVRYDKTTWNEITWICPQVVVAFNEGGHNSTGICLDCIIEASISINLK